MAPCTCRLLLAASVAASPAASFACATAIPARGWLWGKKWFLSHRPDGSCVFLSDQGRCRIHERHGYEAKPLPCRLFPFVLVPHRMDVAGGRRAGQFAGSLGGKYDPLLTGGDPNDDDFKLEAVNDKNWHVEQREYGE